MIRWLLASLAVSGLAACAHLAGDRPAEGDAPVTRSVRPTDWPSLRATVAPKLPALRDELLTLLTEDQAARTAWVASQFRDKAAAARMREVDQRITARMKAIIATHGWPTAALVGKEGAFAAFVLVQHADGDPAFQARCLPMITAAATRGELEPQHVALLTDRVLLAQGKPQRYGTQFTADQGDWVPRDLEDPPGVDARRAAMGLMPLAEYKAMLIKANGLPSRDLAPIPKASPAHARPVP